MARWGAGITSSTQGHVALFDFQYGMSLSQPLTHWGRVTHIYVIELTIIGSDNSDNGLSPGRRQAIIWTNAWILLILTLATNFWDI